MAVSGALIGAMPDPLIAGEYIFFIAAGIGAAWGAHRISRTAGSAKDKADEAKTDADEAKHVAHEMADDTTTILDKADDARVASVVAGHIAKLGHDQSVQALQALAQLDQLGRMYADQNEFSRQQAELHARELGRMQALWEACEGRHEEQGRLFREVREELAEAKAHIQQLQQAIGDQAIAMSRPRPQPRGQAKPTLPDGKG